ncbi:MAG: PIN domain-containing protein [Candidatus Micrarchaeota archaeon]|nr:PIN domain-containing protein [Candidatus Micrarchaeota archaeon]
MKESKFFDTNILCYAYSTAEPKKRGVCKSLVERVFNREFKGVVSNQVLGEFFSASTSKLLMPVEDVKTVVKYLIASDKWQKVNYTYRTIENAISLSEQHKMPFWDTLIAQTMIENGITEIFTENEKDFGGIPGIKVTNPFVR